MRWRRSLGRGVLHVRDGFFLQNWTLAIQLSRYPTQSGIALSKCEAPTLQGPCFGSVSVMPGDDDAFQISLPGWPVSSQSVAPSARRRLRKRRVFLQNLPICGIRGADAMTPNSSGAVRRTPKSANYRVHGNWISLRVPSCFFMLERRKKKNSCKLLPPTSRNAVRAVTRKSGKIFTANSRTSTR